MARKKIVAGNWKMNKTPSEAVALVEELKPLVANENVDVVFCVPAIDIIPVVEATKGTNIQVGAENMYFEDKGAYTGEIAPAMLTDIGVKYVIIGHSERRHVLGESDALVGRKTAFALEQGLKVMLCIGEKLEDGEPFASEQDVINRFRDCGYPADTLKELRLMLDEDDITIFEFTNPYLSKHTEIGGKCA